MKKLIIIILTVAINQSIYAQIGINTETPDDYAALEISSNTKGLLIPRFTSADRSTLAAKNPTSGITVYDTELRKYFVWDKTEGKWFMMNPGFLEILTPGTGGHMIIPDTIAGFVTIEGNFQLSYLKPYSIVETDGTGYLIAADKKEAYNKDFGYVAGTVAEGNHIHSPLDTIVNLNDPNLKLSIKNGVIVGVGSTTGQIKCNDVTPLTTTVGGSLEYSTIGTNGWYIETTGTTFDVTPASGTVDDTNVILNYEWQGGYGSTTFKLYESVDNTLLDEITVYAIAPSGNFTFYGSLTVDMPSPGEVTYTRGIGSPENATITYNHGYATVTPTTIPEGTTTLTFMGVNPGVTTFTLKGPGTLDEITVLTRDLVKTTNEENK